MRVRIDSQRLGTSTSLIIDPDGTYRWGDEECEVSVCGSDDSSVPLEDLAQMMGIDEERLKLAPPSHVRAFKILGYNHDEVPWSSALRKDLFIDRVERISQCVQDITRRTELVRYVKTYRKCRGFLRRLRRPTVDIDRLNRYVEECDSGESVLASLRGFKPRSDSLVREVKYSQTSTVTGRLVVDEGPSILTLPKRYRYIIRSPSGGRVYEVDFVSLEPRFALLDAGVSPPGDIYNYIRHEIFHGSLSRKAVKTATISALYGSSPRLMTDLIGDAGISPRSVVRRVKEYFSADDLGQRLTSSIDRGRIYNYYGRPIAVNRDMSSSKLISYYIQSSCVDTALLGFLSLNESFHSLGAHPIYVIHDAVLVDVPVESEDEFIGICKAGVDLNIGHFTLGVNRIS